MEFGPRALGARSIVATPRDAAMKDRLNGIKDREDFRPLRRPIVCTPEDALECFYTTPLDALALGPFLLTKD